MGLGAIIRDRREGLGLTQDQVASKVGISKPYLSNIETGKAKNPPTDPILVALESVMGFHRGQLVHLAHLARTPLDVRDQFEILQEENQKLRAVLRDAADGKGASDALSIDFDRLRRRVLDEHRPSTSDSLSVGVLVPVVNKTGEGYPVEFAGLDYPSTVARDYIRCLDLNDAQAFAIRVVGDTMHPEYVEGNLVAFSPNTAPRSGDDCFVRFTADHSTSFRRFYQDSDSTVRLQPLNSAYPAQTFARKQIDGLWPAVFRVQRLRAE